MYKLKELAHNLSWHIVKPMDTDLKSYFVGGCVHSGTTSITAKIGHAKAWEYFTIIMNKSCIVEKTQEHIHTPNRMKKMFPNATFIVMVRNILDTCSSIDSRFSKRKYSFAIKRWNIDKKAAIKLKKQYPDDTLIVKFEEFTENPLDILKGAFSFLDITWDMNILESGETAYNKVIKKEI